MKVVASIGEGMVEFSSVEEGLYRRGFAGDALNTAWALRGLCERDAVEVRFVSALGDDPMSDQVAAFLSEASIGADHVRRIPGGRVGLYMITLDGHERSFSYWRDTSAARLLAADRDALAAALRGVDVVYLSGITLAILSPDQRETLVETLGSARDRGALVAFDPNIRPALWESRDAMASVTEAGYRVADLALPTYPDERMLFDDADAHAAARRIAGYGAREVVVKCGADPCVLLINGHSNVIPAVRVTAPVDTSGAGDSFNAGYLAARLAGLVPAQAAGFAHQVAAEAIGTRGALVGEASLRELAVRIGGETSAG